MIDHLRSGPARLVELDAAIMRGLADADAGRTRSADEVFDRLEARYRAREGRGKRTDAND